jgi:hypothetical protein
MVKKGIILTYYRITYNQFLKDLDFLGQIGKNNIKMEKDKIHIFCSNKHQLDLFINSWKPINQRRHSSFSLLLRNSMYYLLRKKDIYCINLPKK